MLHNASQDTVSYKRIMGKYSLLLNQTQGNTPESNKAKKATLAAITSKEIFSVRDFVLWVIIKSLSEHCMLMFSH